MESREMPSPLPFVVNWAALVAICALPYLKLRHQFGLETTEAMQWSLVAVGAFGTIGILCTAWQVSRARAVRASSRSN
jgi:hypothetical protein